MCLILIGAFQGRPDGLLKHFTQNYIHNPSGIIKRYLAFEILAVEYCF